MPPSSPLNLPVLVDRVEAIAAKRPIFLVGGAVRDALLGRESHDFDFATDRQAIGLARRVAGALDADFYVLDEEFDAARVITSTSDGTRDVLDFSSFRGEDLEADLAGRDFTINALAFDLHNQTIWDPLNGAADVRGRIIRACSSAALKEDPIRILRAVRLAAALDFKIDPGTREQMKDTVGQLPQVSGERQRDELFKILEGRRVHTALRALEILGVIAQVLPELSTLKGAGQSAPHVHDVWEHTLSVIQNLEDILLAIGSDSGNEDVNGVMAGLLSGRLGRYRSQLMAHLSRGLTPDRTLRALLYFSALFHDVSKPAARTVDETGRIRFLGHESMGAEAVAERCRRLALSNDETSRVRLLIQNHMRFPSLARRMEGENEAPTRRAIYRFFRDAGDAGTDLVLLGLADLRGTMGHTLTDKSWDAFVDVARNLLENYWEKPEESVTPPRLLDGNELMREYGLAPGPTVGDLLMAIREAQAAGEVSTREQALAYGRAWLAKRTDLLRRRESSAR